MDRYEALKLLGLKPPVKNEQIRDAYQARCAECFSDRSRKGLDQKAVAQRFLALEEAYRSLLPKPAPRKSKKEKKQDRWDRVMPSFREFVMLMKPAQESAAFLRKSALIALAVLGFALFVIKPLTDNFSAALGRASAGLVRFLTGQASSF